MAKCWLTSETDKNLMQPEAKLVDLSEDRLKIKLNNTCDLKTCTDVHSDSLSLKWLTVEALVIRTQKRCVFIELNENFCLLCEVHFSSHFPINSCY